MGMGRDSTDVLLRVGLTLLFNPGLIHLRLLQLGRLLDERRPTGRARFRSIRLAGLARFAVPARPTTLSGTASSPPTNLSHMPTIHTDLFASLPTGGSRLVRGELVCLPLFMSRSTAFASDFALATGVH
jgi:hypothetical protein